MPGPEQGQRATATAVHRSSWAVPAAALGLVTVALAGASLLWAGGPGWRATSAAIRSMMAVDMGAVSRDPGHLHPPGQLERQMEPGRTGCWRWTARVDVKDLDPPHVSAARLAANCGYVAHSQT